VDNHLKYSLTAIQLYAVVKVQKLRNHKSYVIFNNLIDILKKLETGIIFHVRGENIKYFGILALVLGDTPALNGKFFFLLLQKWVVHKNCKNIFLHYC